MMTNDLLDDVLTVLAAAPGNRVTETELLASLRQSRSFCVNTYGNLTRRWVIPSWERASVLRQIVDAGVTCTSMRTPDGCVRATYYSL